MVCVRVCVSRLKLNQMWQFKQLFLVIFILSRSRCSIFHIVSCCIHHFFLKMTPRYKGGGGLTWCIGVVKSWGSWSWYPLTLLISRVMLSIFHLMAGYHPADSQVGKLQFVAHSFSSGSLPYWSPHSVALIELPPDATSQGSGEDSVLVLSCVVILQHLLWCCLAQVWLASSIASLPAISETHLNI